MAESNNRVRIDFDVNAKELIEITKAINILDKFNKQASQVTSVLGTLTGSMDRNAKSSKSQKDEYVNLDRAMNAWASRLKSNQSSMQSYEASQAKLTERLKQYGRDVKVSVDETGKLSASFKNAEGNIVSMTGQYDKATNSIKNMKTNLSTASEEVKKKAAADKKASEEMDRLHRAANKVNKEIDAQKKAYAELTRGTDLSRVIKTTAGSFDIMTHAVKENAQVIRASIDRNGKFSQSLRTQDGTLRTITGYYDKANQKIIQYSDAVSRADKSMRSASGTTNKFQRDMTNLERSMQGLNKYTLTWADAIEIATTRMLQWNVAGNIVFGIQRAFKSLISTIFELDSQFTQLKRVMDEGTDFPAMMEDSIRLTQNFGRSLTDINEALITFARSGFNSIDTRHLSEAATLMANVSDINMFDASETLTSGLTLFNIKARDSIQVVNKLNEVDNDYSISTQQLAKSITRAGGTAAAFGVDLNELIGHTTAIGVATRESGQIIGNSLKSIYSRVNTLPKAQGAIRALGVELETATGDNRDVSDILNDVAELWPKLSNAQKQNTAINVAGTYQLNRFLAMMSNYEMGLEATATAQDSYNSAILENAKFMDSLGAKLNLMKSAFQQLAYAIGEAGMYKAIELTLQALTNLGTGFVVITETLGKWTFVVPVAVAALGLLIAQFQKTKIQVLAFQATMIGMNTNLSRQALAMSATATSTSILGMAFGTLRTAALNLTTALLTNPLTWIIAAVTAIPMVIGHFQRLKSEQEALRVKAEDTTAAFKDFKKEMKDGLVDQTSLDVYTAKMEVADGTIIALSKTQKEYNRLQGMLTSEQKKVNGAYGGTVEAYSKTANWQTLISKTTKDELADLGIKTDKYKSIEALMGAVEKRQTEYGDAVKAGEAILEESNKKLMFHADAFDEVGEAVTETMDIMQLFFGVNDKMVQELTDSYNAIQVLSKVKEKDEAQTAALDQAWELWEARLGMTREEIEKQPGAMKENIQAQIALKDKWGEATQKILTNEQQKQLAIDITKQKTKEAAIETAVEEKRAAEEKAQAAEKEAKRKAKAAEEETKRKNKAFGDFRKNMEINRILGLGYTAEEIANSTKRGNSTLGASKKSIGALKNEGKQTTSTKTEYDKLKTLQNKANKIRADHQFITEEKVKESLAKEAKKAEKTAKDHTGAAKDVAKSAESKKDKVISAATTQNKDHKKLTDDEIGSVIKSWTSMEVVVSKITDWIKNLFGLKSSKKSKSSGATRAYAKGTSASGHAGGMAIVGEEGPELAHIPNYGTTVVGQRGPEFLNLPKGTSVLPNKHTENVLKKHGFPGYAGGVGDFFDAITKGSKAVWETGTSKFGMSDDIIPSWFNKLSGSPTKWIGDIAVKGIEGMMDEAMAAFGNFKGGGAKMAQAAIVSALKITGSPMSWLAPMMSIAQKESGFNPKAINNWDINAKRGDPSVGLFQVIGSTFKAHMMKGMGDRTNPVHSAVAAIRYMNSRYGGVWGHPGVKSMAKGGGYKPYANGGMINKPHLGLVGEAGPEAIIPLSANKRSRAMDLYQQTGKALGVVPYANGGIPAFKNYRLKSGDTLGQIARMFSITMTTLRSYNKTLKSDKDLKGRKVVRIPTPSYQKYENSRSGGSSSSSKNSNSSRSTLKTGSTGSQVKAMQKILGVKADGVFGKDTLKALKKYQKSKGLIADGVAGKATLDKMFGKGSTNKTSTVNKTIEAYDKSVGKVEDFVSKMQGLGAGGYSDPKYLVKKFTGVRKDYAKASTEKKMGYNNTIVENLSKYTNSSSAKKAFDKANLFTLSAGQKKSVWKGIEEAIKQNIIDGNKAKSASAEATMSYKQALGIRDDSKWAFKTLTNNRNMYKGGDLDSQRSYNTQVADALRKYTSVTEVNAAMKKAGFFGLSKEDKKLLENSIRADVVKNTIDVLSTSTTEWLDKFNKGLTTVNQKVSDWLSLADSMKSKQEELKKSAFVDDYVSAGMDKYGMIEHKTGAEGIQERMDSIKSKTENLLTDNATIKFQYNPAEIAKRTTELKNAEKKIQDKIKSVTADAKKKGLKATEYASILEPLNDQLTELKAEQKALADATALNNNMFKTNEGIIANLGSEYQKLQAELIEAQKQAEILAKQTEMLDKIKEKVASIFNWDSSSMFSDKTDEFGNSVRDIEGTIRTVLDVQKAIKEITADIYSNIDKTVEEMITSIIGSEMPDLTKLFGEKSDYSGISTGISGAIDTIKPTWDSALSYMSGSMTNMFTGVNWQETMKKWTEGMATSMEGLAPLFENLMIKFPEVIAKVMSELPNLVYTAMQNLTVGVFNTVVEVLNRLVATVNQIVPAGSRVPMFDQMQYATPTYTQNNETKNDTKTYQVGGVERNVTYIVNTGVAIASESELREFAMVLKGMMDEEEGRGGS